MDDESGDATAIARFQDRLLDAVRRAVLAEREACAKCCEPHADDDDLDRQAKAECAAAIRNRQ